MVLFSEKTEKERGHFFRFRIRTALSVSDRRKKISLRKALAHSALMRRIRKSKSASGEDAQFFHGGGEIS